MTDHSFTSSSGNTLHLDGFGNLCIDAEVALEKGDLEPVSEFFQYQRDQQLGRTRWPENPDYVIYRGESEDGHGRSVRVVDEQAGRSWRVWENVLNYGDPIPSHMVAAHWYFTEGPGKEPERPLEDARPGDLWEITVQGDDATHTVFFYEADDGELSNTDGNGGWWRINAPGIKTAKLIHRSQADDEG